jgi:hypothetical protein
MTASAAPIWNPPATLPERARAGDRRRALARIVEHPRVGEELPALDFRELPAHAEPRVHFVVDAERLRTLAVEVVREAVDVDADLVGERGGARGGERDGGDKAAQRRGGGRVHVVGRGAAGPGPARLMTLE